MGNTKYPNSRMQTGSPVQYRKHQQSSAHKSDVELNMKGFQTQNIKIKKKILEANIEQSLSPHSNRSRGSRKPKQKKIFKSKSRGGTSMYSMYKNAGFESDTHSSIISLGSKAGELTRMLNKNAINSRRFFLLDQKNLK